MKRVWMWAALMWPAAAHGGLDKPAPQIVVESRIVEVGPGVLSANFGTNLGNVYANFPGDMAFGDHISGTFATLPKGNKESEREANAAVLRSLKVDACGSNFTVGQGLFVCPEISGDTIRLALRAEERELATQILSVPRITTLPESRSFVLPTEGLVFNRALIAGPFDGDLTKTSVTIGGTAAHLVAESPRACIFDVPKDPIGRTRLEFRNGSEKVSGDFRTVGLRLTPPRPIIHTGDSTSFAAEVTGLAGLERPLRLNLRNLSTEVISMESGDEQSLTIAPAEVTPAGTFAISRRLSGKRRGDYTINVSIPWSQENFRKP
jgi:hypothetical protein